LLCLISRSHLTAIVLSSAIRRVLLFSEASPAGSAAGAPAEIPRQLPSSSASQQVVAIATQRQFLAVCVQAECGAITSSSSTPRTAFPFATRRSSVGRVGRLAPRADRERCPVSRHREQRTAQVGEAGRNAVHTRAGTDPTQQTPFLPRLNSI
jgi:hypothetical protein